MEKTKRTDACPQLGPGLKWLDRGCLALAYVIIAFVAIVLRTSNAPLVDLLIEALGGLIPAALPAWIAHARAKAPAPYHLITLFLAVLMAFGRFYAAAHQ